MSRKTVVEREIRYESPGGSRAESVAFSHPSSVEADSETDALLQSTGDVQEPHFVNLSEPITELLPALSAFVSASASVLSSGYNNLAVPLIQKANELVEQSKPVASESLENLKDTEFVQNLNRKIEVLHEQLVASIEMIKQKSLAPGSLFSSASSNQPQQAPGQSNEETTGRTIWSTRQTRAVSREEARNKVPLYRTEEEVARDEALERKRNKEEWPSATHAMKSALEKLNEVTDKVIEGLPENIRQKIRNHIPAPSFSQVSNSTPARPAAPSSSVNTTAVTGTTSAPHPIQVQRAP